MSLGYPRWLSGKEFSCQIGDGKFDPWVGRIPWRRKWQPTPVFLPGNSHGHNSLVGYSPWGHKRIGCDLVTKQQQHNWVCCCSVTKLCLTVGDPMDCTTPGFPVLHYLPEFAQSHVCWVSDVIQSSHPLVSPSPLPSIFPSIRIFSKELDFCLKTPKYWRFSFSISLYNEYPGLISFKIDWFDLLAV